jgi:hypothetical protein
MANTLTDQHESNQFSGSAVLNVIRLMFGRAPLSEVLATIARLIEAQGDGMLCAIWLLDDAPFPLWSSAKPSPSICRASGWRGSRSHRWDLRGGCCSQNSRLRDGHPHRPSLGQLP